MDTSCAQFSSTSTPTPAITGHGFTNEEHIFVATDADRFFTGDPGWISNGADGSISCVDECVIGTDGCVIGANELLISAGGFPIGASGFITRPGGFAIGTDGYVISADVVL